MLRTKSFIFSLFFLFATIIYGGPKIDSLQNLLSKEKNTEAKALLQSNIARLWSYSNADSGIKYSLIAYPNLKELSVEKINCLISLACSYRLGGKNDSALQILNRTLLMNGKSKYESESKRNSNLGNIHNLLGLSYHGLGKDKEAVTNYLLSIDYYKRSSNADDFQRPLSNLAIFYAMSGDLDKSLEYFIEIKELYSKTNQRRGLIETLVNIGAIYQRKGDYLKAIEICNEALSLVTKESPISTSAMLLGNIGVNYSAKKFYQRSIDYFKRSLEKWVESGDSYGIITAKINLAEAYTNNNQLDLALKFSLEASEDAVKTKSNEVLMNSFRVLSDVYRTRKDFEKAYYTQVKVDSLQAVNMQNNNSDALAEMRTKFDTEKKEQANKLLAIENKNSQNEIQMHKKVNTIISVALIVTLLLVYLVVTGLKKQRRANKIINEQKLLVEEQKKEVEEKQKEVMDSIRYAQRIQKAQLPSENFITKKLLNLKKKD